MTVSPFSVLTETRSGGSRRAGRRARGTTLLGRSLDGVLRAGRRAYAASCGGVAWTWCVA